MNPLTIKLLALGIAIALAAGLGYGVVSTYKGAIVRAEAAETDRDKAKAELSDLKVAREKERKVAALDAAATKRLIQENEDAKHEIEAISSRLAAGTVRVRDRFTCPSTDLPGVAASTAGGDAAGERGLRVADADFLVRFAGEADSIARRLALCQDALTHR